jgi:predicted small secreted protein
MKKLLLCVAVCALLGAGCQVNDEPGFGRKIGQITKLSHVGLFAKTWEADLIRGGLQGGSGVTGGGTFHFTIENDDQRKAAQDALENQTEVIIDYRTEFLCSSFRTGSGHFLVTITPKQVVID